MQTRATHRILTHTRPPLYCLREGDAHVEATARLPAITTLEVLTGSQPRETWMPMRVYE